MRSAAREMSTVRRLGKNESGMTLGLTMVMIVLIGVMGAGLLTFASTDLGTVVEVNRGQRAFEVADAGVGVAKRQLTSDCLGNITCIGHYDDFGPADLEGPEDFRWSEVKGGVTLNDLDGDNNVTSVDSVKVTIDYRIQAQNFQIISTGTYGASKRKIEAILKAEGDGAEGEGIGHPVYYTPSNITIEGDPAEGDIDLSGTSMFTEQDIIIEGLQSTRTCPAPPTPCEPEGRAFKTDYENSGTQGIFVTGGNDFLEDWYTPGWQAPKPQGDWNTVERKGHTLDEIGDYPNNRGCARDDVDCISPGFAAEGKICGVPVNSNIGSCDGRTSIADGVYAYDCTTGPVPTSVTPCARNAAAGEASRGNDLTFVEKQPTVDPTTGTAEWGDNEDGTLTFPFPKLKPREARLKAIAREQQAEGTGGYYYRGCSPPWNTILNGPGRSDPLTDDQDVIFIDAGGCPNPIEMNWGGNEDAIMVVWCGVTHHTNDTRFRGILMNLNGDGLNPDGSSFASNCGGDMSKGVYTIDQGSEMWGWLYSEGGTATRSGIVVSSSGSTEANNSVPGKTILHFRSGANWNFLDDAFTTPTAITEIRVLGWRELYE